MQSAALFSVSMSSASLGTTYSCPFGPWRVGGRGRKRTARRSSIARRSSRREWVAARSLSREARRAAVVRGTGAADSSNGDGDDGRAGSALCTRAICAVGPLASTSGPPAITCALRPSAAPCMPAVDAVDGPICCRRRSSVSDGVPASRLRRCSDRSVSGAASEPRTSDPDLPSPPFTTKRSRSAERSADPAGSALTDGRRSPTEAFVLLAVPALPALPSEPSDPSLGCCCSAEAPPTEGARPAVWAVARSAVGVGEDGCTAGLPGIVSSAVCTNGDPSCSAGSCPALRPRAREPSRNSDCCGRLNAAASDHRRCRGGPPSRFFAPSPVSWLSDAHLPTTPARSERE
eukprot:Opistho-1_new@47898